MKPTVILLVAGIASLCTSALVTTTAEARPMMLGKPAAKKGPAKPEAGPTELEKKVKVSPDGLKFGMTLTEVSKLYEKVFDDEFIPLYKKTEPGPRMAELDSELADKKQLIQRNKLELSGTPSGLDNTPLGGEYTYDNGESLSQVKLRSGTQRYFFFFGDHLWKVIDIHKLGAKSKMGEDYDAALAALTKQLGKPPRVSKADPSVGRVVDQADWADKDTVIRLSDYGQDKAAIGYSDRQIEEHLDRYRTHKATHDSVDSTVSDVTRTGGGKGEDKNKDVGAAYTSKKKQP